MLTDKIPMLLPDERRRRWLDALRILDDIVEVEGFHEAEVQSPGPNSLWTMGVSLEDDEIMVDGPQTTFGIRGIDDFFDCKLDVYFEQLDLQVMRDWMELWTEAEMGFLPEMLLDDQSRFRSHQASEKLRFTFLWPRE